ncbi:hypothetical protein QYF61_010367 [Mycteria americana]|uniref:Uncharacterized protein n=1 Tax=Mycteria americana TaxID=33587 RepID=A0AAN7N5F3_MYCAM|nr:hypothetical protein QYF61_010367 [Mycteria americana]
MQSVHLGRKNPMHQYTLCAHSLESSFAEKEMRFLLDKEVQCTRQTLTYWSKSSKGPLRLEKRRLGRKEVLSLCKYAMESNKEDRALLSGTQGKGKRQVYDKITALETAKDYIYPHKLNIPRTILSTEASWNRASHIHAIALFPPPTRPNSTQHIQLKPEIKAAESCGSSGASSGFGQPPGEGKGELAPCLPPRWLTACCKAPGCCLPSPAYSISVCRMPPTSARRSRVVGRVTTMTQRNSLASNFINWRIPQMDKLNELESSTNEQRRFGNGALFRATRHDLSQTCIYWKSRGKEKREKERRREEERERKSITTLGSRDDDDRRANPPVVANPVVN